MAGQAGGIMLVQPQVLPAPTSGTRSSAVEGIGEGLPHLWILERFPIHIEHEIVRARIGDGDELPAQDRIGFERGMAVSPGKMASTAPFR